MPFPAGCLLCPQSINQSINQSILLLINKRIDSIPKKTTVDDSVRDFSTVFSYMFHVHLCVSQSSMRLTVGSGPQNFGHYPWGVRRLVFLYKKACCFEKIAFFLHFFIKHSENSVRSSWVEWNLLIKAKRNHYWKQCKFFSQKTGWSND